MRNAWSVGSQRDLPCPSACPSGGIMPRHDYVASPGGTMRNKMTGHCKGVTKSGSKYRAKVWCAEKGQYKNLGTFANESAAAVAVAAAEAAGTQCLPSPRLYRRRNRSTAGALQHARTQVRFNHLTDCSVRVFLCALCWGSSDGQLAVAAATAAAGATVAYVRHDVCRRCLRRRSRFKRHAAAVHRAVCAQVQHSAGARWKRR